MNLTVRLLGCEVFAITTETETEATTERGDATTTPQSVGFTNQWQGHGNEEDR